MFEANFNELRTFLIPIKEHIHIKNIISTHNQKYKESYLTMCENEDQFKSKMLTLILILEVSSLTNECRLSNIILFYMKGCAHRGQT